MASDTSPLLRPKSPTEQSPLLPDDAAERADSDAKLGDEHADRVPVLQVVLLMWARAMELMTFFSIFPFVNQMIWRTGQVPKSQTGFYSGLIESLFALTQVLCMPVAARLARTVGKKRLVLFCLVGMAVPTTLFGFCTAIWQMAVCRTVAGVFAAYIVTLRLMVYETSTPTTRARVFSLWSVANNLGMVIGPFVGGILANPIEQYPSFFGGVKLFEKYPYSLASMGAGGFIISGALLTFVFVKETQSSVTESQQGQRPSILGVFKIRGVKPAVFLFTNTLAVALGYTAVTPAFYFVDPEQGGYGFPPFLISIFIAIAGGSQALWILIAFTPLNRRLGILKVLKICYTVWPIWLLLHPLCNTLLRYHQKAAFWATAPLVSAIGNGVSLTFAATQLVINDVASTPQSLDVVNTLAMVVLGCMRTVAPAIFTSLYAFSVGTQILQGHLFWFIMMALPLVNLLTLRHLRWVYKDEK